MSRFGLGFLGSPNGNDAFVKILLHMDGSNGGTVFTDDNANALSHTWTAHSATTNTGTLKFGTASLACGAGVGYIDTPDSADYTLGSGDWTIDFWFNRQGSDGTSRYCFGQCDSALANIAAVGGLLTTNVFVCTVNATNVNGTTAITTTGWHHLALVRTGNILKMFLDGTQEGGNVAFAVSVTDSGQNFSVGRAGARVTNTWDGFIDEFRLSVGVARWTANFTPPTSPYS